jgi:hypothetical protein
MSRLVPVSLFDVPLLDLDLANQGLTDFGSVAQRRGEQVNAIATGKGRIPTVYRVIALWRDLNGIRRRRSPAEHLYDFETGSIARPE